MPEEQKCKACENIFHITPQDFEFYQKLDVGAPSHCPQCRMQRRLSYRNDRGLHHSQSALSGQKLITMYDPALNFIVYDYKEWWSDAWDPLQNGRAYIPKKSFFAQFAELRQVVPRFNLFNRNSENCDFVNYAPHCKNCYLLFGSWFNQDCLYGQTLNECRDCVDNLFLDKSELCYENIDCGNDYASIFCQNCSSTTDSAFCYDCHGVHHCIGCYNLRNKSYHIENKPVSEAEYKSFIQKFESFAFLSRYKQEFDKCVQTQAVHKSASGYANENCSGDYIFQSKNCQECFSVYRSQDISYCARCLDHKDSYDFEGGGKGELCYESMSSDFSYHSMGCTTSEHLTDSYYCDICFNCKNCFGCIGLRNAEYCVLNKQYSKQDYQTLLPNIIQDMKAAEEWGEFFPLNMSPFAYNETMAHDYFPITKEQALKKGLRWKDEVIESIPTPYTLPDRLQETTDAVCSEKMACVECKKAYKVSTHELAFYRKLSLALPRQCPNCRHRTRLSKRNPRMLWNRNCSKCKTPVRTSYAPARPELIYCEECYLREVA